MFATQIRAVTARHKQNTQGRLKLRQRIVDVMEEQGVDLDDAGADELVAMLERYVDDAPAVLDTLALAATQQGVAPLFQPLFQTAANYFLQEDDLIPDHEGMLGLLDDTYLCVGSLVAASAVYQQQTGIPLLSIDVSFVQGVVRLVIGEETAQQLDQAILLGLQNLQVQLQQLVAWQQTLQAQQGSSWGNTFEDQAARFGAEHGISLDTFHMPDWNF